MPTYNGAEFLESQINSILSQTIVPDEIIIVDDGSDDGTLELLSNFQNNHPNIINHFQNSSNIGVSGNFNKAIRYTTGDLIFLSDQDDIWEPEKIETQIDFVRESFADLVTHNSSIISEEGSRQGDLWSRKSFDLNSTKNSADMFRHLLFNNNFVQGATLLLTRDFWEMIEPIPPEIEYDYYIALIGTVTSRLGLINQELLRYRQHSSQDVGAPRSSLFADVRHSLNRTNPSYYQTRLRTWEEFGKFIESYPIPDDLSSYMRDVEHRRLYQNNRFIIYNSSYSYTSRFKSYFNNLSNRYYHKFGGGSLTMFRDLLQILDIL
ncbi:MAG: glycosyltransferase [Halobacteriaceae archaeon]